MTHGARSRSRKNQFLILTTECHVKQHAASFKNQALVLTFRIGSQNVEKHIQYVEKGFFWALGHVG